MNTVYSLVIKTRGKTEIEVLHLFYIRKRLLRLMKWHRLFFSLKKGILRSSCQTLASNHKSTRWHWGNKSRLSNQAIIELKLVPRKRKEKNKKKRVEIQLHRSRGNHFNFLMQWILGRRKFSGWCILEGGAPKQKISTNEKISYFLDVNQNVNR